MGLKNLRKFYECIFKYGIRQHFEIYLRLLGLILLILLVTWFSSSFFDSILLEFIELSNMTVNNNYNYQKEIIQSIHNFLVVMSTFSKDIIWSFHYLTSFQIMRIIFLFGRGIGWRGRDETDICSEISGVENSMWRKNRDDCSEYIEKEIMSYAIVFDLIIASCILYYYICKRNNHSHSHSSKSNKHKNDDDDNQRVKSTNSQRQRRKKNSNSGEKGEYLKEKSPKDKKSLSYKARQPAENRLVDQHLITEYSNNTRDKNEIQTTTKITRNEKEKETRLLKIKENIQNLDNYLHLQDRNHQSASKSINSVIIFTTDLSETEKHKSK